MHKKFDVNRTKIKDGCQSGRKVVTHNSKSDLPLPGCCIVQLGFWGSFKNRYGNNQSWGRLDSIAVISLHLGSNVRAMLPTVKYGSLIPSVHQSFQMSGLIMVG